MKSLLKQLLSVALFARGLLCTSGSVAFAQDNFPNKPVSLIVPYPQAASPT
jgi:tripartite-type tricarboxylate transporter receptor subunit TctC